jgi:hypothetical protein
MTLICRDPITPTLSFSVSLRTMTVVFCYIETHNHDTYSGHFRLWLIEFTPTRLAFEIARTDHKYVEVTFDLDAKRFGEVQRIVHIIFGVRG